MTRIKSQHHGLQLWGEQPGAKSTHGSEAFLPTVMRSPKCPHVYGEKWARQDLTLIEHLSLKELITLKELLKLPNTELLIGKVRYHLLPSGNI